MGTHEFSVPSWCDNERHSTHQESSRSRLIRQMQQGRSAALGGFAAAIIAAGGLGAGVPGHALDGRDIRAGVQQIADKRPAQIVR